MTTVMKAPAVRSFKSIALAAIAVALALAVTLGLAMTVWHTNAAPARSGSSQSGTVTTQHRVIPDDYSNRKGPR